MRAFGTLVFIGLLALAVAQTTDGGAETSNPETTKSPENPSTPAPKPKKKRCGMISMKKLDTDGDAFISFNEVAQPFEDDPASRDSPKYFINFAIFHTMDEDADNMVDQAEIDAFIDGQGCGKKERKMFRRIYRSVKSLRDEDNPIMPISTEDKEKYLAEVDPDYLEFAESMVRLLEIN